MIIFNNMSSVILIFTFLIFSASTSAQSKPIKLKLEVPLNDSGTLVLKPIRTPGTKIPGIAIKWTW